MDLSGVIFVVLALVWAAYLLPKALRHHDEVARTRSVEEVSEQARVVVTAPERRPSRVRRVRIAAADRSAALTPAGRAARRRRRILAVLVAACAVTGVAVAVGLVPTLSLLVPVALLLGFLVLCRVLVRRDHARRVVTRRTSVTAPSPSVTQVTAPQVAQPVSEPVAQPANQPVAGPVEEVVTVAAPAGSLDDTSTFRELVVGMPAQRANDVSANHATPAGSLWDPLPVTLPTYVGKPRAMRSVRTITFGDPGVSSSGRDAGDSALVAEAASTYGATPASGETPRVVGG